MPFFVAHFRASEQQALFNTKLYYKDHSSVIVDGISFTFNELWLPPLALSQRLLRSECIDDICEQLRPSASPVEHPPTILYYGDFTKPTADLVTMVFSGIHARLGNPGIRISVVGSCSGMQQTFANDLEVGSWFEAATLVHECLRGHLNQCASLTSARLGSALAITVAVRERRLVLLDVNFVPLAFREGVAATEEEKIAGLKARIPLPASVAQNYRPSHVILDCPVDDAKHDAMKDALHFGFHLQRELSSKRPGNIYADSTPALERSDKEPNKDLEDSEEDY